MELEKLARLNGASLVGATQLSIPLTWEHYSQWLDRGYHADMHYLVTHAPQKKAPQELYPEMKSAFVFAFDYVDHPEGPPAFPHSRLALYSKGLDYHHWLKKKLETAKNHLQSLYPDAQFWLHTDSGPVLERDLAYRAGLGWFGKNTCLIHRKKGSLFLIGEIFSSLEVSVTAQLSPDFCGTCQKCIEICPTQALEAPRLLNAEKCISYWTIESRQIPPRELRKKMGDWLFGCDLCQTVCPWNQKIYKEKLDIQVNRTLSSEEKEHLIQELKFILESSHRQILKKIAGTPLTRAGAKGLKRNALIVIGNQKIVELKDSVRALANDTYLGELCRETLIELEPEFT